MVIIVKLILFLSYVFLTVVISAKLFYTEFPPQYQDAKIVVLIIWLLAFGAFGGYLGYRLFEKNGG